jgi:hypothetical protein
MAKKRIVLVVRMLVVGLCLLQLFSQPHLARQISNVSNDNIDLPTLLPPLIHNFTNASTSTSRHRNFFKEAKANKTGIIPDDSNNEDLSSLSSLSSGCEWNSSETAVWTNNTEEENDFFWKVLVCHRRLNPKKKEQWNIKTRPPPSSLRCGDTIMKDFSSIISSYNNLYLFGDSIIRQQFYTMVCMLNTSVQKDDIWLEESRDNAGPYQYIYNSPHKNHSTSIMLKPTNQAIHRSQEFQLLAANATKEDALVINQGAWYYPNKLDKLQLATESVVQQAHETNATVMWVETSPFEWPSTTGEFVPKCTDCKCEALTPQRIGGYGNFTGPPRYLQWDRSSDYKHFTYLYPDIMERNKSRSRCIPNCFPANWRNDVTNAILSKKSKATNYSSSSKSVTIVPIWKQLVAFGFPQPRHDGDCTHKSTDALIASVQQMLRSMKRHAMEF